MSTKQKLIAAANAAKLDLHTFAINENDLDVSALVLKNQYGNCTFWNPYRFLIDATRLACALRIDVEHHVNGVIAKHLERPYAHVLIALDETINDMTARETAYCTAVTDCAAMAGGYSYANTNTN